MLEHPIFTMVFEDRDREDVSFGRMEDMRYHLIDTFQSDVHLIHMRLPDEALPVFARLGLVPYSTKPPMILVVLSERAKEKKKEGMIFACVGETLIDAPCICCDQKKQFS